VPAEDEVRLRLIRADDRPTTNPCSDVFEFGLQDAKQRIVPAERLPDGRLAWNFTLRVKPGSDPARPNFLGQYASGPPDDRFVYLSWRSVPRQVWIVRVKARLAGIDWAMVRAAQAANRPLVADMSGWTPHDRRKQVAWRVADD
jgi:hypothetical protein